MLPHPFHQREDGGNAYAAGNEAVPRALEFGQWTMDEFRGSSQRPCHILEEIADIEGDHFASRVANGLHHQGDGAVVEVGVTDGQGNAFSLLVGLDNHKLAGKRGPRNLRGLHFNQIGVLSEFLLLDDFIHRALRL